MSPPFCTRGTPLETLVRDSERRYWRDGPVRRIPLCRERRGARAGGGELHSVIHVEACSSATRPASRTYPNVRSFRTSRRCAHAARTNSFIPILKSLKTLDSKVVEKLYL